MRFLSTTFRLKRNYLSSYGRFLRHRFTKNCGKRDSRHLFCYCELNLCFVMQALTMWYCSIQLCELFCIENSWSALYNEHKRDFTPLESAQLRSWIPKSEHCWTNSSPVTATSYPGSLLLPPGQSGRGEQQGPWVRGCCNSWSKLGKIHDNFQFWWAFVEVLHGVVSLERSCCFADW